MKQEADFPERRSVERICRACSNYHPNNVSPSQSADGFCHLNAKHPRPTREVYTCLDFMVSTKQTEKA